MGGGCLLFPARELIRQEGRGYVREASELTDDRMQFTESNWKGEVHASHSAASRGPLAVVIWLTSGQCPGKNASPKT